jgi:hypothetical protein
MHPEQAEITELLGHRAREGVVFEPFPDVRQHAVAHERAHRVADEPLVVGEQRVDAQKVERVGRCGGRVRASGGRHAAKVRANAGGVPGSAAAVDRNRSKAPLT